MRVDNRQLAAPGYTPGAGNQISFIGWRLETLDSDPRWETNHWRSSRRLRSMVRWKVEVCLGPRPGMELR